MKTTFFSIFLLILIARIVPLYSQIQKENLILNVAPGKTVIPASENLTAQYLPQNPFGSFNPGLSVDLSLMYNNGNRWSTGMDGQLFLATKPHHTLFISSFGPVLKFHLIKPTSLFSPFILASPRFSYTYFDRSKYVITKTPDPSSDQTQVDIKSVRLQFGQLSFGVPSLGAMGGGGLEMSLNQRVKTFIMFSYTYLFDKNNRILKENFPLNNTNLSFVTAEIGLHYKLKEPKAKKYGRKPIAFKQKEKKKSEAAIKNKEDKLAMEDSKKIPTIKQQLKWKVVSTEELDSNTLYTLNGIIEDTNATRVKNVSIQILDASGKLIAVTKTNNSGLFAYKGLRSNDYIVAVQNESQSLKATINFNRKEDNIKIEASTLKNNKGSSKNNLDGVILGKAKLSSNGLSAPNEPILLLDNKGNLAASTQTNKDGRFAFRHLKSEQYEVIATKGNNLKVQAKGTNEDPEFKIDESDFNSFKLKKLANGASPVPIITGKLNPTAINRDLTDQTVLLLDDNGNVVDETKTSDEGRFAFKNLKSDNYQTIIEENNVRINAKAHLSSTDPTLNLDKNSFTFGKLNNDTSQEKLIIGRLEFVPNTKKMADATVLLIDANGKVADAVRLNEDGSFIFKNVIAADYQVAIEGAEFQKLEFEVAKSDPDHSSLNSSKFQNNKSPNSKPQNVVVGKIDFGRLDSSYNKMNILLLNDSGLVLRRTTSDNSGNFAFQNIKKDNYQIVIPGSDYKKIDMEVVGPENAPKVLSTDFHYKPSKQRVGSTNDNNMLVGKLSPTVNSKQILDQKVLLIDGKGSIVGKTEVNEDGSYIFDKLRTDNYQTVLEKPDPTIKSTLAPIVKDPELQIFPNNIQKYNPLTHKMDVLTPKDHMVITGSIRSKDISETENRAILLLDKKGNVVKEAYTDKNGVFKFSGIPANEYQIVYQDGKKPANTMLQMYKDNDTTGTEQTGKIVGTIYYELNKVDLNAEIKAELEKFIQYYQQNKNIRIIKLSAYGDAVGTEEANLSITQKRALLVREYLIFKGIPKEKIQLNPMGKSLKFKNKYNLPDGKLNRKVDLEIIE